MDRNKFYVVFGEFEYIVLAVTQQEACEKAFKAFLKRDVDDEHSAVVSLPRRFKVSQRGHEPHDDDLYLPTEVVVKSLDRQRNQDGFEKDV